MGHGGQLKRKKQELEAAGGAGSGTGHVPAHGISPGDSDGRQHCISRRPSPIPPPCPQIYMHLEGHHQHPAFSVWPPTSSSPRPEVCRFTATSPAPTTHNLPFLISASPAGPRAHLVRSQHSPDCHLPWTSHLMPFCVASLEHSPRTPASLFSLRSHPTAQRKWSAHSAQLSFPHPDPSPLILSWKAPSPAQSGHSTVT